jgi:peroxiredoxin Q/BCP
MADRWCRKEPAMTKITIGDPAPQFTATAHTGQEVALADYLGKQVVVLYFYPRDGTPLCTAEACRFRDAYADFVAAGAVVIGVSVNSTESHRQFADDRRLPFLLISDQGGALQKAFGVPRLLGFLPGRTTYVIDKQGLVRHIFTSHFSADQHIEKPCAWCGNLVRPQPARRAGERVLLAKKPTFLTSLDPSPLAGLVNKSC